MPLDPTAIVKCIADQRYVEMSFAIPCSRVPRVQVALVFHKQMDGRKDLAQTGFDQGSAFRGHGNAFRNGLTVTLW